MDDGYKEDEKEKDLKGNKKKNKTEELKKELDLVSHHRYQPTFLLIPGCTRLSRWIEYKIACFPDYFFFREDDY